MTDESSPPPKRTLHLEWNWPFAVALSIAAAGGLLHIPWWVLVIPYVVPGIWWRSRP